ncbi:hypothetical protein RF11_02148 [Thelohanellus kitauei]|uniref:Uncharacterized protein n=1 Tax=Thelohanellus kitauei TaxID=669202 RepID=A0A0C2N3R6_THEKT|nr:hypothetical protein RF11_02148 [Thelohanellus kitauei]
MELGEFENTIVSKENTLEYIKMKGFIDEFIMREVRLGQMEIRINISFIDAEVNYIWYANILTTRNDFIQFGIQHWDVFKVSPLVDPQNINYIIFRSRCPIFRRGHSKPKDQVTRVLETALELLGVFNDFSELEASAVTQ